MGQTTYTAESRGGGGGGAGRTREAELRFSTARSRSRFGAVLLIVSGVLGVFSGIAAIAEDSVFVSGTRGTYFFGFELTGWGWFHLLLGLAALGWGALILGLALVSADFNPVDDAPWTLIGGVVLAAFSLLVNFFFLPYAPVWGIIMIAVAVLAIWGLTAQQRTAAETEDLSGVT